MPDISDPRSDSYAAYVARVEAEAPLDTSGPLPKSVGTLAFIPKERRQNYARKMDGSFALRFINTDDEESMMAYSAEIGKGLLPVVVAGETPESVAARGKANEKQVQDIIEAANKRDADAKAARLEAAEDAAVAAARKQFGH